MPQTFIYVIALCICGILHLVSPPLARLLTIVETVCLGGIVVFGLLETYQDIRQSRSNKS